MEIEKVYTRIVLFKRIKNRYHVLMQKHKSGKLIFPGGELKRLEDPIDGLIRELGEESHLSKGVLRLLTDELLWGSCTLDIEWEDNTDFLFIVKWNKNYADLLISNEPEEILDVVWIPFHDILTDQYLDKIYPNMMFEIRNLGALIFGFDQIQKESYLALQSLS